MAQQGQRRKIRLGALFASLVLLFGAIYSPLILAAESADLLANSCCAMNGHCCCASRRSEAQADGQPAQSMSAVRMSCTEQCAVFGRTTSAKVRAPFHQPAQLFVVPDAIKIGSENPANYKQAIRARSSAPRAPPLS